MEKITLEVNVPSEFKEEFKLALDKVVKQFIENLKLSFIDEISGIPKDDKREVKESIAKEVVASVEETSRKLKSGEIKPITLDEFNKWCE